MNNIVKIKNLYFISWNNCYGILLCLFLIPGFTSCKKYLDLQPEEDMALPSTLKDCQALLDNYSIMNTNYPIGDQYADDYYLTFDNWKNQYEINRDGYIWKSDGDTPSEMWMLAYQKVLYANEVLETLEKIVPAAGEQATWNRLKGAALFLRSLSFYMTAQIWAKPYDATTASTDPGIPLRLSSDISEKSVRGTVAQTYDRILTDLNDAVTLLRDTLPTSVVTKSRPGQAAAHALLARVLLSMSNYNEALIHADKCLQRYNTLIDFNTLNYNNLDVLLLVRYNKEVIFHASSYATIVLDPTISKVDSNLHRSYETNDLRRIFFFRQFTGSANYSYQFLGSYNGGRVISILFCGLATDEMYLIRAECYARAGNTGNALADLNTLLKTRWKKPFTDITATSAGDALAKIVTERRKELLYRGLRWPDLRRLNKEPAFAVDLIRQLDLTYTLPANDLRYTLLLPQEVVKREPMVQNPR